MQIIERVLQVDRFRTERYPGLKSGLSSYRPLQICFEVVTYHISRIMHFFFILAGVVVVFKLTASPVNADSECPFLCTTMMIAARPDRVRSYFCVTRHDSKSCFRFRLGEVWLMPHVKSCLLEHWRP